MSGQLKNGMDAHYSLHYGAEKKMKKCLQEKKLTARVLMLRLRSRRRDATCCIPQL